jgi:tRNA-2-methylthio-N6-dimethylallyladenosine synthase
MKRGYSREDYLSKIAYARSRVPGIALSTDVIVGFPGESERDFLDTLSLVEEGRFEQLYAFTYSSRPGTEAAAFEESVAPEAASERLQRLFALQKEIQREINAAYVGRVEEILVEGTSALDPQVLTGRTRTNRIVNFPGPCDWTGQRVDVRIREALPNSLRGIAAEGPYSVVPLTSIPSGDITRVG